MAVTWWAELKRLQFSDRAGRLFLHPCLTYGCSTTSNSTPLLLLHGFLGDKLSWQYCLAPLARHGQVFAIDLPGHGKSASQWPGSTEEMVDWLEDAMDALSIGKCHLIAHSLGAWIALHSAKRLSRRLESLTLIACAGLDQQLNWQLLRKGLTANHPHDALDFAKALTGESGETAHKWAQHHVAKMVDPQRRLRWLTMFNDMTRYTSTDCSQPFQWQTIQAPLKFIWCRNDAIVPLPKVNALATHANISLHDVGGHIPHILASGWLTGEIAHFLDHCAQPA